MQRQKTNFRIVNMELNTIIKELNARVKTGSQFLHRDVEYAFASDLMSDVLTVDKEDILLITGLANLQTIRTAEMADIRYIIFARDKKINSDIENLAIENDMVLIESKYSIFKVSGILYNLGIKAVY